MAAAGPTNRSAPSEPNSAQFAEHFQELLAAADTGDTAKVGRLVAQHPELICSEVAEFRDSALHRAVLRRDETLTRLLMQLGADARAGTWPHRDATSAYAIAVDREYGEIVAAIECEEMARRSQRVAADVSSASAASDELEQAIGEERVETIRELVQRGAGLTPAAAVALGDRESIRRMSSEGRLANEIHLIRGGLLSLAVRLDLREMVATLLDLGLDPDEAVNTLDGARSWGMPLWFASRRGRYELAELLLERGADVNAIVYASGDPLGQTNGERLTRLLLRHGARVTVEQLPEGEAGRQMATAILAGTLAAASLNVDQPTQHDLAEQMLWATGDTEIVRLCLPLVPRAKDDPWWNYVFVSTAEPEKLRLLLEHGVDPNVRGGEGYTLLHHLAAEEGHGTTEASRVRRAAILLDAGASTAVRDVLLKSTPLGWACRWGRYELVQLYLERGVTVIEPDAEPWATPLAWAAKRGHHAVRDLLQAHAARSG